MLAPCSVGQIEPTTNNFTTHYGPQGETVFRHDGSHGGVVAFFESFFHYQM
jgi:hypothetical protein